jgi:hypothetical protein
VRTHRTLKQNTTRPPATGELSAVTSDQVASGDYVTTHCIEELLL